MTKTKLDERDRRAIRAGLGELREYWLYEAEQAPGWAKCSYCEVVDHIDSLIQYFEEKTA
jgi:hypothetical protein